MENEIFKKQDFENIVTMIKQARIKAYSSVNKTLIDLYYSLWRMKQFYETYKNDEKLSTLLRELSWSQNLQSFSNYGCRV